MDPFLRITGEFEVRLGLGSGFFNTLIAEDDWAFLLKTHAFVDAGLTHAICAALLRPELESVVSRLDTANTQCGKIAFAKQLGLLDKSMRRYVIALSQLRNEVAHNIRSADFRFLPYWAALSPERHVQVCAALALDDAPTGPALPHEIPLIALVNEFPKLGISYSTAIVMSHLYMHVLEGGLSAQLCKVGCAILGATSESLREAGENSDQEKS